MKELMAVGLMVLMLCGCAMTRRVEYVDGKKVSVISHYRFVTKEDVDLDTKDWSLRFNSMPDPESVQLMKEAFALGQKAKMGVAP